MTRDVQGLLTTEHISTPHNLLTHINTKTKKKRCYQPGTIELDNISGYYISVSRTQRKQ